MISPIIIQKINNYPELTTTAKLHSAPANLTRPAVASLLSEYNRLKRPKQLKRSARHSHASSWPSLRQICSMGRPVLVTIAVERKSSGSRPIDFTERN
jgi:hypothetical protein